MRRLILCLICLMCFSLGSRALAQDFKEELALKAVRIYTTNPFPEELSSLLAPTFWDESNLCSETPPTEFETLPDENLNWPVGMLERVGTDQGVMYVLLAELDVLGGGVGVQSIVCEDSPAGQAVKAVASDKIRCWQDTVPDILIEGHWTNREGNRVLVRLHMPTWSESVFVYIRKEGDGWTYEKSLCGSSAEGAALSLITEYLYDFRGGTEYSFQRPYYYLGSRDKPVFAEVTSVRQDNNADQSTVLIQLETFDEYEEEQQADPVCMLKLRDDGWWIVYEIRCTSN